MTDKELQEILSRPIAFHSIFGKLFGATSGLMLSQAIYWTSTLDEERNGWFWKKREEWKEETSLTRDEQETSRKKLIKAGVLEEKLQGIPAKMWFKVNLNSLNKLIAEYVANKLVGKHPTSRVESTQHTITETTTENTSIQKEDSMETTDSTSTINSPLKEKISGWKKNKAKKKTRWGYQKQTTNNVPQNFEPLDKLSLWKIAKHYSVAYDDVKAKHEQVLLSIEDGNKYNVNTIELGLKQWISRGIDKGEIQVLTEWQQIDGLIDDFHPDEIARRKAVSAKLQEAREARWAEMDGKDKS